jgi:Oligosaccharyl transferase STT3, N-terminal
MTKAVYWALVLLTMALVLWIRLVPQSLLVTDDWADRIVRRQIYEQVTREVPQHMPPSPRGAPANVLINQWIDQHQAQFKTDKAAIAQRLKSQLSYTGNDGQEYVYLGDFDSYLWLRHARNYLRTGTTCDAVVDGACRDIYTNAPVGARTIYARSLHTAAIAGLHTLITRFRPDYPLPASAFLVPVIIGGLGVPPAFFIARGLSGTIGGLLAALLIALHPIFLHRSIGSDNDVWNVALPLYMMWAAMAAMAARGVRRQSVYSGLAGIGAGLQAWTWRGWLFSYVVLVAGLVGHGLLHSARYAMQQRTLRIWQAPEVRKTALVLMVFYIAAGLCTTLAGSEAPYLTIPFKALGSVIGSVAGESPGSGVEESYWPNALTTVAELLQPQLWAIARSVGGVVFFLGGLVGLLLLLLPKGHWRWWHFAVLLGGTALYGYRLTGSELSRSATMGLLTAPLIAALLVQWYDGEVPRAAHGGSRIDRGRLVPCGGIHRIRWPPLPAAAGSSVWHRLRGRYRPTVRLGQAPGVRGSQVVLGSRT